jgi:hypothetical protein
MDTLPCDLLFGFQEGQNSATAGKTKRDIMASIYNNINNNNINNNPPHGPQITKKRSHHSNEMDELKTNGVTSEATAAQEYSALSEVVQDLCFGLTAIW